MKKSNRRHNGQIRNRRSRTLLFESLERFASCLAVNWRNPVNSLDVTGDGVTVPLDALNIINEINNNGSRQIGRRKRSSKAILGYEW